MVQLFGPSPDIKLINAITGYFNGPETAVICSRTNMTLVPCLRVLLAPTPCIGSQPCFGEKRRKGDPDRKPMEGHKR
jgi:hypothetical protein